MKPAPFEKTPEFQNFTAVMKRLIAVPKAELDDKLRLEATGKRKDDDSIRARSSHKRPTNI